MPHQPDLPEMTLTFLDPPRAPLAERKNNTPLSYLCKVEMSGGWEVKEKYLQFCGCDLELSGDEQEFSGDEWEISGDEWEISGDE